MPTRMRLIGAKYSGGAAGVVHVTCRAVDGLRVRSLSHPVKKALAATGERAALYKTRNFPGAPVQSLAMLSYALRRIAGFRSEEHTSELQSHHPISYAVFCLK